MKSSSPQAQSERYRTGAVGYLLNRTAHLVAATFEQELPHLIEATDKVAEELASNLEPHGLEAISHCYLELCNPDPYHRGHPKSRGKFTDPYSLERYVSFFDSLSSRFRPGQNQG